MALTQLDLALQALDGSLSTAKIANLAVTNGKLAADSVTDDKVSASAAIAFSKLASLTAGNLLIGNASNVAASIDLTSIGDIEASATGGLTYKAGSIVDADINASAAIALSKLAEAVIQADGGQAFTADQSMGGFKLTSLGAPTAGTDAVTKGYVDGLVSGLKWKDSVAVATTANITLSGEQTIDGILTSGSRVLVKNQTAGAENGIYVSAAGAWSRSTDADSAAELEGAAVFVQQGTVNADTGFTQNADGITLGTTALTWVQFTSAGGDADTLDGLDSTQFLRSDANDSVTTGVTLNIDSGATLSIDGTWDIAGAAVTSSAAELNLLDGKTGTVWTSDNDGAASGLDADLLDGQQGSAYLRSDANDSVTTGVTLNIDSGATLSIDGAWDIAGTAVTSNATELNLLDGLTGTIWTSTNDGTSSGLDADTVDGNEATAFLRTNASSAVATGNTLNIDAGATLSIDGTWDIGGTAITTTAAEINALGSIAIRETPAGLVNGSNTIYTLANTPIAGSEEVYFNGVLQDVGGTNDYTISGGTITFTFAPPAGSKIRVSYRH